MTDPAIVIDGVSKRFRLYRERNQSLKAALMRGKRAKYEEFWALRDVGFEIPQGSTFGLMGVNGSGKSTLLKCIAGIYRPDTGTVTSTGKMAALLELGSGFHPELSGRENVYLNGSILGLSKRELDERFDEIVDFAGVEHFIDQPVKNYSSGMYVRLGFSVAINVDPEILLVDEVLAVGDVAFQDKCMAKFADFKRRGRTVVIVSHSMGAMRSMCDGVAWLEGGQLVETGPPEHIIDRYVDQEHSAVEQEDGSRRWGTGEAVVTTVEMLDGDGGRSPLFHTGDRVTIRMHWSTPQRLDDPVFGLTIWTREGHEVWSQHTRDAGVASEQISGEGHVDFTIPALPLLSGAYDLSASIVDRSLTHVYDYRRYCYPFHVEKRGVRDTSGLVAMGGSWAVPNPASAARAS